MRLLASRPILVLGLVAATGCSSAWIDMSPIPPTSYVKLGPAEGTGCATYFLPLPWHQFLAFGANDRLARARVAAIESVPEATGLLGVTVQERWFYWILFSRRCAVVRGEAIR